MLLIGISVDPGRTAMAGGFLRKTKKKNIDLWGFYPHVKQFHRLSLAKASISTFSTIYRNSTIKENSLGSFVNYELVHIISSCRQKIMNYFHLPQ